MGTLARLTKLAQTVGLVKSGFENDRLITFETTHHAVSAERVLNKDGVPILMTPTPNHIDSNCGIAVSFCGNYEERVVATLKENGIQFARLHNLH